MIKKTHFLAAVFAALLLTACSRPFVLIPGGALVGQSAPAPQSWSFTDAIDTIQLETNPADPYSVNIWVVGMGNALYVHAGANRATWIENMDADPNVRLQAGDTIYELAASRVTSQEEFDRYSAPYEEKYGNPPRNLNVVEAYLYRLVAR